MDALAKCPFFTRDDIIYGKEVIMESTYEKINTEEQVPALIRFISKEVAEKEGWPLFLNPYVPPHWHRSIEISMVMEGEVSLWINEEQHTIKEQEFLLINSGFVHELTQPKGIEARVMLVIISYDFLKRVVPNIDSLYFDLQKSEEGKPRLKEIYYELKDLCLQSKQYDYLKLNALLYEIIYILVQYYTIDDEALKSKYRKIHVRQRSILDYIEEHYHEDVSLELMSQTFHMSIEHFSRTFYKDFGVHFKTYLNAYRVYQAYRDVVYSENSMQQIALKHGFSNVKSFITQFKQTYDETPYQYRKLANIKK